jgi:hypothetical protein
MFGEVPAYIVGRAPPRHYGGYPDIWWGPRAHSGLGSHPAKCPPSAAPPASNKHLWPLKGLSVRAYTHCDPPNLENLEINHVNSNCAAQGPIVWRKTRIASFSRSKVHFDLVYSAALLYACEMRTTTMSVGI